jgi:hypothetical protein
MALRSSPMLLLLRNFITYLVIGSKLMGETDTHMWESCLPSLRLLFMKESKIESDPCRVFVYKYDTVFRDVTKCGLVEFYLRFKGSLLLLPSGRYPSKSDINL